MCLTRKAKSELKIAKQDIIVFKIGYKYDNEFKSPFQKFIYHQDVVNTTNMDRYSVSINVGFHSFPDLKEFHKYSRSRSYYKGIFVIPKGAKYYEGTWEGFNNYASNKLIFKGFYSPELLRSLKKEIALKFKDPIISKPLPSEKRNPKGLHKKYEIKKIGSTEKVTGEYFVLRLDDKCEDEIHLKACRKAVLAYAESINPVNPKLSEDIIKRYKY